MIQHQYSLAKRGKWICPQCHHKTFVCYVDESGQVLNENVGKCDRADKCAYHYPPRQYFADNQVIAEAIPRSRAQPMFKPLTKPTYIDSEVFKRSVLATKNHNNNLVTFLNSVFDTAIVERMKRDYYIGTSKHWEGATVFYQVDRYGKVHRGKIMLYNPTNGKRVKEPFNYFTSVHAVMKLGEKPPQCLFGEHLLRDYPDMTVAVVESEKTAIIASGVFGDCIVVACGGCGNLTNAMCEPLRGRDVVLFPDNGKLAEWREKGLKMRHLFGRLRIADIMEREAVNIGDDIGDLIVERYPEWDEEGVIDVPIDLGLTEL